MSRALPIALALTCWLPLSGWAATPPTGPVPYGAGPEAFQMRLATEPPQNRVLMDMEIGARSFWHDDSATAKAALDEAILKINSVFANDPNAAKARQLWYDEGSKDFKGEPYERAMVFLYRGLIYLQDADYDNARAAFRQGLLQDAFAEEEQYRSDFAVLLFLDAWASHLSHSEVMEQDAMKQLKALRPNFGGFGEKDDTLIFAESGLAPRKLGDGADHAFFVYRRGKPIEENQVQIVYGNATLQAYPMEDIFFQASTRGGRQIDQILQGKATFKAGTGTVGSFLADTSVVMTTASSAFHNSGSVADAGAAVGALAGVFMIVSSRTQPQADVRTWTSLPDTVHVLTLATGGKPLSISARYLKDGTPAPGGDKPVHCQLDTNHNQLCLVRAH